MWRIAGTLLFAFSLFFASAAQAAQDADKAPVLADFDGVWLLDEKKSASLVKEAAGRLAGLGGFKFSIEAEAMSARMEWADDQPKTYRIISVTAEGGRLACALEGHEADFMILEKVSADEILVWDRAEALAFVRVVQSEEKAAQ